MNPAIPFLGLSQPRNILSISASWWVAKDVRYYRRPAAPCVSLFYTQETYLLFVTKGSTPSLSPPGHLDQDNRGEAWMSGGGQKAHGE
jgi:hypothetical protein